MKRLGTRSVSIAAIEIGARLRQVSPDDVQALAASIRETGLQQPIQLLQPQGKRELRPDEDFTGPYQLIAGAHRIGATSMLGQTEIEAVVFWGTQEEARLQEIDENLFRRELTPLDRAKFLVERKTLYETLHPEAKQGGDRRSADFKRQSDAVCSFTDDVAERLGLAGRTVRDAIWLWSRLDPQVREALALHPAAKSSNALRVIAKEEPDLQRKMADLLVAGTAETAVEARDRVKPKSDKPKPKFEEEDSTAGRLVDAWQRTSRKGKLQFLRNLVGMDVIDDFRGENVK